MLTQTLILVCGLILLYAGSHLLVEGSVSTAILFAVKPVIIGLTIVSLATSAPELLVSLVAAVKGSGGISIGNILGSNVINILLVLGISAAIKPVMVSNHISKVDIPYMVIVSGLFWVLCLDGLLSRSDGSILLVLLIIFLIYGLYTAKGKQNSSDNNKFSVKILIKNLLYIIVGILMLAYGANFVVKEAIAIATQMGLSQTFIGISVVALGTSLPELATSIVAASKGQSDISVGNVVGSNLFNICLVMGMVGLFNPMQISGTLHGFQFPFMVSICLLLGGISIFRKQISRVCGLGFVSLFIFYIVNSYI